MGRACDQSLPLAIFMPSPHCLQGKGKGGADGSVGIGAPGWWGVGVATSPDVALRSVGSAAWESMTLGIPSLSVLVGKSLY